jgi:hypothetical protein
VDSPDELIMLNYSVKQTADYKIICNVAAMEQLALNDCNMHTHSSLLEIGWEGYKQEKQ